MRHLEEAFESILNDRVFKIDQPGPLRAPIRRFRISRDNKLQIILKTITNDDTSTISNYYPEGTVRISKEQVRFVGNSGVIAIATGVETSGRERYSIAGTEDREVEETSNVHLLELHTGRTEEVEYVVDWFASRDDGRLWPDLSSGDYVNSIHTVIGKIDGIEINLMESEHESKWDCANLKVDGLDLYIRKNCSSRSKEDIKFGMIIYPAFSSDEFRRKVRNCLSFSLGFFLVHLGDSTFCKDWRVLSLKAISVYSIDKKVFELPIAPPAPLGGDSVRIEADVLTRMVNSLYSKYDGLHFDSVSWAYWHALCAPIHIAAAHFGSTIEALQNAYASSNPGSVRTKIISERTSWKGISEALYRVIETSNANVEDKKILYSKISNLNSLPQGMVLTSLFVSMQMNLADLEKSAWKRRNDAAHGLSVSSSDYINLIREVKILRIILHRIVLKVTEASDTYIDYYSIGFPIRKISESL